MYCFVTKDGLFVSTDSSSGGYPYKTDNPLGIATFPSKQAAENYQAMFSDQGWIMKKFLGIQLEDV